MVQKCPICTTQLSSQDHVRDDRHLYPCPRCGSFAFTTSADFQVEILLRNNPDFRACLSHAVRKMADGQQWVLINSEQLKNIIEHTKLPTPQEQLENLILWLGEVQKRPGVRVQPALDAISRTGAADFADLHFIVNHAISENMVEGGINGDDQQISSQASLLSLTFKGWAFYEELQRGHGISPVAFMAMKFNEPDLDLIVENHFKPAVAATGFELRRINDGQPAGLIDDRLRVAIRQARFVVADLTHHNNGAYWEAGYAEGLGKPVIYTCRRDVFDDKSRGTHFDTNHHLTVHWEADKPGEAAQKLKDAIRATLPEQARQED